MEIVPIFTIGNEKGLSVVTARCKAYWAYTPGMMPTTQTIYQVAVFADRDDDTFMFVPMVPAEHSSQTLTRT